VNNWKTGPVQRLLGQPVQLVLRLEVVSEMLICEKVICDILMNAFTPWCFATAAVLTVAAK
jgi:hypothetical protein